MLALNLLVLIAVFSVLAVILIRLSVRLTGRYVGERVDKIHREAQFLTDTGEIPPNWPRERLATMSYPDYERYVRKRLGRLRGYFAKAPVFEDRETRAYLETELARITEELADEEHWLSLKSQYGSS